MKSYPLFLFLISASLLFFNLGSRPLISSGEARASQIAVEMLKRGDLLLPYLNEEILLTKPPFFHWIIIFSYKLFGVGELASRFPSSLAGIFTVIMVYLLGKRFWDRNVGFIAGLLLTTSPLFFWSARCARIDGLLLFLITISLYCFWRGYEDLTKGRLWFLGWFLFMGLGVLAKGPVGIVIPLGTVVVFLLSVKKLNFLKSLNWFWGLLVFFIIVSPWFIAIYLLVPQDVTKTFFVQQNWAWLTGGGEWYKGYVYIPYLFIGFFPWSLALPIVFMYAWKEKDEKRIFLWIWVLLVFLIFGLTGKKVGRYILPLYPAISLLTAGAVYTKKDINRIFSFSLVVVWFFIVLAVNSYNKFLEPELISIIGRYINNLWFSAIGFFIIILGLYGMGRGGLTPLERAGFKAPPFLTGFTVPVSISFISLIMFIIYFIPVEKDYYSPKPFCEMLKEEIPMGVRLYAYKSWDNTIRYYFGRHVNVVEMEGGLSRFLNSKKKAYCLMWEDVYKELPEEKKEKVFVVKTGYKVLEHKVVLVTNKI